ncbi:MAG: lipocalin-like domain-containing protein [Bryobacteraceae bacterium]|nr:lipocalin-like domain-containing protein [Bryobacteraceae bacterium]
MKPALLILCAAAAALAADFKLALPGYRYEFPRDHFAHPDFKTEWWYYTGNLQTAEGRRFGFELVFFRQAVAQEKGDSVWAVRDVWPAHLALSDIEGKRFFHTARLNRTGPALAGADPAQSRIWNGNWQVRLAEGKQFLEALTPDFTLRLELTPAKPPVIHGRNGVSQKAEGEGRASHYISFTRLAVNGGLTLDGRDHPLTGTAWMDHEFFTHQLEANQSGWDWFSIQLDDSTELMMFRLRRKDGSFDPYSAGTYVDAKGAARPLSLADFKMTPLETWKSPETAGAYPIRWRIEVPSLALDLTVTTPLPAQELTSRKSGTPTYWEGAIDIKGTRRGAPITGRGYLEMTGYAAPVTGL